MIPDGASDRGWFAATVDGDGVVLDGDDELVRLLGPARADVVGTPLTRSVARRHHDDLLRLVAAGTGAARLTGLRGDGLPWVADVHAFRLGDGDGNGNGGGSRTVLSGRRPGGPVRWRREHATTTSTTSTTNTDTSAPTAGPPAVPGLAELVSHDLRGALRGARGFTTVAARALASGDEPPPEARAKVIDHLATASRSVHTADEIAEGVVGLLRWSAVPLSLIHI